MATVDIETPAEATAAIDVSDAAEKVAGAFKDPDWLLAKRRKAWEVYRSSELPDRVTHLWRYTDPTPFVLRTDNVVPAEASAEDSADQRFWEKERLAGALLWRGNGIAHLELDPALKERGVMLVDLHTAARDYGRMVEAHLGKPTATTFGKFEALNAALWQAGAFLHIPRNVVIKEPIHITIAGANGTAFLAPRVLLVLEQGAQATVVNEYVSARDAQFDVNTAVEAVVGSDAHLRLVTIQHWGERVTSYFSQRATLARDATLLGVWAGLGAGLSKADLGARLDGKGADVKMLGMSFGQRDQHFDQHTLHDHRAANTTSDLDFKIVLKDRAQSAYTGLIRIEPHATNCEAFQENRNLLLSDGTRADTIPELEILNDEVRCSHGATIGPLDEEQLHYLAARGIPRDEAIRMVVSGFVEPTLLEMPEDLRERLRSYVMERVKEI